MMSNLLGISGSAGLATVEATIGKYHYQHIPKIGGEILLRLGTTMDLYRTTFLIQRIEGVLIRVGAGCEWL